MHKHEILNTILEGGVVAIVRVEQPEALVEVADAIYEGGVTAIEFTMTTPNALSTIEAATEALGDRVLIGAGTVLDAETARAAILAGATFVVSPITRPELTEMCHRYGAVCISGAYTPNEILTAWEMGADLVKLFPAGAGGPSYLKAVRAPLPQISIVPTGGVSPDNVGAYVRNGAVAVAVGSSLVNQRVIDEGDMDRLTVNARALVDAVRDARAELAEREAA